MLIQCDDSIRLISEKTRNDGSGVKIGLAEDYRKHTEIVYSDGKPVIYSYWNNYFDKYISPSEYSLIPYPENVNEWAPCYERKMRTSVPDSCIRFRANNVFIELVNLSFGAEEMLFASRYRKLLESFHETRPNVFEYKGRGGDSRAFLEASRNKLVRWFRLYEYELNILFTDRKLGRQVFEELKDEAVKVYDSGLYIKGFGEKKGRTTIKIYKVDEDERGELFKIELTFRKNCFNKNGIDIRDMTSQESCVELLRNEAILEILKFKGGEAVKQLQFEFATTNNILARLAKVEAGFVAHDDRIEKHDDRIEKLEKQYENINEKLEKQYENIKKLLEKKELVATLKTGSSRRR